MNIKEAKEEIKHTLLAYNRKDAAGRYTFPRLRQRPILLMGPPGIGKTAVMEQVAEECGVGLVAYTITHHTRQSAVGLPRIVTRCYNGKEVSITEYTLSEIIASVYDCMERTGKKEGILFIDEINCVSETLAPTMLQFLQNKTFGSHSVPEGWLIAAAGNPPEYNKSVREFDIVTLDRVRRMDIEEDLDVWMEYAWKKEIHGSILAYLGMKKDHFYSVENTVDGKFFVTARGWEDLSEILKAYEELGVEITENLIGEYLCRDEIARSFFASYQLYRKYGEDYGLKRLLSGEMAEEEQQKKVKMAEGASFEERFLVTGLLLSGLNGSFLDYEKLDKETGAVYQELLHLKAFLHDKKDMTALDEFTDVKKKSLAVRLEAELLNLEQQTTEEFVIRTLEEFSLTIRKEHITDTETGFERIRQLFTEMVEKRKDCAKKISRELERAFAFMKACFGDGQETVLFVTGLTRNSHAAAFIREYGCDPYFACSEKLLYRKQENLRDLVTVFSLLAIIISLVGVFGLVVFETQYRRKEIGIRKVHGATVGEILLMFNKAYLRIVGICFVIAAPIAWQGAKMWLEGFAYKTPLHWWVFLIALLIVTVITLLTVSFQNWKAANENPVNSIKSE